MLGKSMLIKLSKCWRLKVQERLVISPVGRWMPSVARRTEESWSKTVPATFRSLFGTLCNLVRHCFWVGPSYLGGVHIDWLIIDTLPVTLVDRDKQRQCREIITIGEEQKRELEAELPELQKRDQEIVAELAGFNKEIVSAFIPSFIWKWFTNYLLERVESKEGCNYEKGI
jgi:hypothetical protein